MPDQWETFRIEFKGGLITNLSPLQQAINQPGSARILRNYEPSIGEDISVFKDMQNLIVL